MHGGVLVKWSGHGGCSKAGEQLENWFRGVGFCDLER